MPRSVAVVFVHGILTDGQSYAEEMRDRIVRRLPSHLRTLVAFQPAFWAKTVRGHQRNYAQRVAAQEGFGITGWRQQILEGLGDAAAYQKTRERHNSAYYDIQNSVDEAVSKLDTAGHESRPLVFIGHSLGCQIISSYAWDLNWLRQRTDAQMQGESQAELLQRYEHVKRFTPFRRLETMAGLVTMGSNMPLFTFTFGPPNVYPITTMTPQSLRAGLTPAFPGPALPPEIAKHGKWLNFYSRNDFLGFPIKPLNDAYRDEARIEDVRVKSQTVPEGLQGYMPLQAHQAYWTHSTVINRTAALLKTLVES